jgi:Sulfotransferase family
LFAHFLNPSKDTGFHDPQASLLIGHQSDVCSSALMKALKFKQFLAGKLGNLIASLDPKENLSQSPQLLYALASQLDLHQLNPVTLAGGLPRSGTTFLEAVLQAHPQIICMQEFMPLKTGAFAGFVNSLRVLTANERTIWTGTKGENWRGFSEIEDTERLLLLLIACLGSTTHQGNVATKSPGNIRVVFCKTPSAEIHFLDLANAVRTIPLRYVHCIREPQAWVKSIWAMPWEHENDPHIAINEFCQMMHESAKAFEAISRSGISVHLLSTSNLWDSKTRDVTMEALCDFLGVKTSFEMRKAAEAKVDPWPIERRRKSINQLTSLHLKIFEEHPGTKYWRQVFAMPMPSSFVFD